MAINEFVSTRKVINDFCDEIGIEHNRYMPLLKRLAKRAYKEINGGGAAYKKRIVVLMFDGCYLTLPSDAVAIEGIVWGDHGCECNNIFDSIGQQWPGQMFMNDSIRFGGYDGSSCYCSPNIYNFGVEDNVMKFDHNFRNSVVTARIQYVKCDEEGFLIINDIATPAIQRFFEMILAKQTEWKNKEFRMSSSSIENKKNEWVNAMHGARGDLMQSTPAEERAAVAMYNNPLSGSGATVYSYYDLIR